MIKWLGQKLFTYNNKELIHSLERLYAYLLDSHHVSDEEAAILEYKDDMNSASLAAFYPDEEAPEIRLYLNKVSRISWEYCLCHEFCHFLQYRIDGFTHYVGTYTYKNRSYCFDNTKLTDAEYKALPWEKEADAFALEWEAKYRQSRS